MSSIETMVLFALVASILFGWLSLMILELDPSPRYHFYSYKSLGFEVHSYESLLGYDSYIHRSYLYKCFVNFSDVINCKIRYETKEHNSTNACLQNLTIEQCHLENLTLHVGHAKRVRIGEIWSWEDVP